MERLNEIYQRIGWLRQNGLKMKDIAAYVGWPPSVLSALYSTVLPAYARNRDKGLAPGAALSEALVWANNVSRKRVDTAAPALAEALIKLCDQTRQRQLAQGNPYVNRLEQAMQASADTLGQLAGVYLSYSRSSSTDALKAEPYLLRLASNGSYVEVLHKSAYGVTHRGFALLNGAQQLYLIFNENPLPQLSLFHICLRLPLYDRPRLLRGVYVCGDYNANPVARRIVFVRQEPVSSATTASSADAVPSDRSDAEALFNQLQGTLKLPEALQTDDERACYAYTCGPADIISLCTIPAPTFGPEDLLREKELLGE